ncbi:acetylhydrolase [Acrasis kona]|uniref:1-alkyl-2-acetylglycerophosphocholine esterase n=1 Tax=Acrasis kona TaxID=1008807 RepID=A0AAW2Z8D6_9EUKA
MTKTIPPPTGPYVTATETVHWTTDIDDKKAAPNGLLVKIWYPIDADKLHKDVKKSRYMPKEMFPYMWNILKPMPKVVVKTHIMNARTNSYTTNKHVQHRRTAISLLHRKHYEQKPGAHAPYIPISSQRDSYPVIIFSHGLYGVPEHYTYICENMASNGYVVIAPYHTDGSSLAVLYPTGDHLDFDAYRSDFYSTDQIRQQDELVKKKIGPDGKRLSFSDLAEHEDSYTYRNHQLKIRVRNIKSVLCKLQFLELEPKPSEFPPSGHMNLDKIGIMGHSFGGATAISSMLFLDQTRTDVLTLKCCCALDSYLFPMAPVEEFDLNGYNEKFEKFRTRIQRFRKHPSPMLFLNSDEWQWEKNINRMKYLSDLCGEKVNDEEIKGTKHHNFDDASILFPHISRLGKQIGSSDPEIAGRELITKVENFFSVNLAKQGYRSLRDGTLTTVTQTITTIAPLDSSTTLIRTEMLEDGDTTPKRFEQVVPNASFVPFISAVSESANQSILCDMPPTFSDAEMREMFGPQV